MSDDMHDDDAAQDAALDYEDEAQLSGGRYYDEDDEEEVEYFRGGTYEGRGFRKKIRGGLTSRKGGSKVSYFMNKITEEGRLHHSNTYRSNSGFLLIGDKRDLVLAPFYAKSSEDKLPESELPREVYDALKSDQLKHLKISEDPFSCFFGLWYRVNVVPAKCLTLNLSYPKTARIIPISVSKWNTLKGGGDAITKLIGSDSCRERIGIRGEGTVACVRILMICINNTPAQCCPSPIYLCRLYRPLH
eukprot:scaffold3016_cov114-Skeletonema_dohrnii-CCMP3373.AAC.3